MLKIVQLACGNEDSPTDHRPIRWHCRSTCTMLPKAFPRHVLKYDKVLSRWQAHVIFHGAN